MTVEHGRRFPEAAKEHYLAQPAVSRSLKGLVQRKLVSRKRDPKDQRIVRLNATAAGSRVLSVLHAEAESSIGILMSRLSPRELQGLFLGLAAFVRELSQLESTAPGTDREAIARVAKEVASSLRQQGFAVDRIEVPVVRHPHQDQLDSLLLLQLGVGGAAVALSIILIGTSFAFMMARQAREIAILKTIGASAPRLAG